MKKDKTAKEEAFIERVMLVAKELIYPEKVIAAVIGGGIARKKFYPQMDCDLFLVYNGPFEKKFVMYKGIRFELFFCNKNDVLQRLKNGDNGWMHNVQNGIIIYDPKDFLKDQRLIIDNYVGINTVLLKRRAITTKKKWKELFKEYYFAILGNIKVKRYDQALLYLRFITDKLVELKRKELGDYDYNFRKTMIDAINKLKGEPIHDLFWRVFTAKPRKADFDKILPVLDKVYIQELGKNILEVER